MILSGDISWTMDRDFIMNKIIYPNIPNTIVLSLDENNMIPKDHPKILGGSILLPPIDALIADADGDEMLFDRIYNNHFNSLEIKEFIGALLAYLHKGGNIVINDFTRLRLDSKSG